MHLFRRTLIFLLLFFTALLPISNAADDPFAPSFVLHAAAGKDRSGPMTKLNDDWSIELAGATEVAGKEIVSLRRVGMPLPKFPREEQIILANGDRIPGTLQSLDGEQLRFKAALGTEQDLTMPLSAVSLFCVASPGEAERIGSSARRLLTQKRTRDLAYLRNGEVLEGTLSGINRKKLQIDVRKKEVEAEFSKLALIAFNTDLVQLSRPKELHARLVLTNGCRLTLRSAESNGRMLRGMTLFGSAVRIPQEYIVAIDFENGCAVYLSDLKPRLYDFTPFLGTVRWPYAMDANTSGGDLLLGKSSYDKGIGMHAGGRLSFDLQGKYRRFESVVGLDEHTGKKGSVRIRVLVDGKRRNLAGIEREIAAAAGPRRFQVDVTAAKELTLEVDFGRQGDVQANVDWADARLIR